MHKSRLLRSNAGGNFLVFVQRNDSMKPADIDHLYFDGRHYDAKYREFKADIPFYLRQVKKCGDPVLELACGTGRVTIPLAESGYKVTGLEVSESMLSQARTKSEAAGVSIDWIHADCRQFDLKKKFRTILFPFTALAHLLDLESVEACFACVRKHLTNQGVFILDYFNPRLEFLVRDPEKRYPAAEYPHPDGKGQVVITENNRYDPIRQINHVKWYYEIEGRADELVEDLDMRIFFPQELDALLRYNGFMIDAKYGDYDEGVFQEESRRELIVCHLALDVK
jgi:SAM-dependent methyltransferase